MAAAILHPGVRATFLNGVLMGIKAAGGRPFEISQMWGKYAALQSAAAEAPYQMTACCDVCRSVLPGGADSPDGVDEAARAAGWKVEGSHFTCPKCAEAACMTRS
jgi:hypothetical protein